MFPGSILEMNNKVCDTCKGMGYVYFLLNQSDYYFNGDEPIEEEEVCEDCGGTGLML